MDKKNIVRKSRNIFIYLLSFSASFVGIALNFFLAKVLEAEAFGYIQYLIALATTCSQFLIFGLNSFLIREAKNEKHKGEIFNKCFTVYLILALFIIPIVFFILQNYTSYTVNNFSLSISVLIVAILMGVTTLFSSYYQGVGKYQISIVFESLLPKLFLLVTAIVFLIIGNLSGFTEKYLLFYIIFYSLVAIPFIIKLFKRFDIGLSFNDFKTLFFFFGVTVTYSLGNNLTKVLQGSLYHDTQVLGIISVSISIVALVRVFTSVLDNLIKPIFAKQKRENNIDGLIQTYRFETRANSYVVIPLYLFFIFHSSKFLVLFGESYTLYPAILLFIALANGLNDITGPNGTLLAMTGKEKWELFNGFIYFGVYFVCIFIFASDSIYGLCIALLIAQAVVNIAKYVEVWLIYKKAPLDVKTVITLLLIILTNLAIILGIRFLPITNLFLWYVISISIGVVLVALNFFVVSLYRKKDFTELLSLRL